MRKNLSLQSGITLLELIITTAIVSIISTISVSAYSGYTETTKVSQSISQVRALTVLIEDYALDFGEYPTSLRDIGNENLKDPWGKPYVYLNLKKPKHENDDDDDDDDDDNNDDDDNDDDNDDNDDSDDSDDSDDDGGHSSEYRRDHDDDGHDNNSDNNDDDRINISDARKDGNLVPINTNYDLCSFGKDGKSKAPLRAKDSHDDVIYANDGAFIGLASDF